MDVLSQLIDLARLRPALDIHCLLGGQFRIDHDATDRGSLPFHVVLGGECRIELDGGRCATLKSGDILLLPRGSAHAIVNVRPAPDGGRLRVRNDGLIPERRTEDAVADVDLLCGHFHYDPRSSGLLLDGLPDIFQVSLSRQQSEERLAALVGILRDETVHDLPGALTIATASSLSLLAMALRSSEAVGPISGLAGLIRDERLSKAVRAMSRAISKTWTLEELGEIAAMSRASFARHFKDSSGMTVGDFLTELRMTKAGDLLIRTKRPVADVAEEVGYGSESAFSKAFVRSKGMTPARFRRSSPPQ